MEYYVTIAITIAIIAAVLAVLASGYVKASPDTAIIISGLRKNPKVLIGRAGVKIPFLERLEIKVDGLTGSGMTWTADGEPNKDPKAVVIEGGVYKAM